MPNSNKYREYFDIDERYFPCIDAAAIDAGAPWENTYPHSTFIDMLTEMERALARQNNGKTLWVEGAYGTGKSQCALALRRILEVPEEELRAYWDRYEPLKKKSDLLEKLIGHKKKGIVVASRVVDNRGKKHDKLEIVWRNMPGRENIFPGDDEW